MFTPLTRNATFKFATINQASLQVSSIKDTATYQTFVKTSNDAIKFYSERIELFNANTEMAKKEIDDIVVGKAKIQKAAEEINKHLDKAVKSCPEDLKLYFRLPNLIINSYTGTGNDDAMIARLEEEIEHNGKEVKNLEIKIKVIKHNLKQAEEMFG